MLLELAAVVAAAYVDERNRWTRAQSLRDTPFATDKWMPAFCKLTKLLVAEQISDYRTYLHVQFESRAQKHIPPTPQQCYGPVAQEKWHRFAKNREPVEQQLATALKFQTATLSLAIAATRDRASGDDIPWTEAEIVGAAICDPGRTMSCLFRYGAARAANLPRAAAEFRVAAYHQYLFARQAYDRVWGDMVPAELRAAANKDLLNLQDAAGASDAE